MLVHTFRPVGKLKKRSQVAGKLRAGDVASWTNPNTGERFDGLEVLQVNLTVGAALLRGYRGGIVRGRQHIETFSTRLDQLRLTQRGGV